MAAQQKNEVCLVIIFRPPRYTVIRGGQTSSHTPLLTGNCKPRSNPWLFFAFFLPLGGGPQTSSATRSTSLPTWLPSNRRLSTSGAFSSPSATVSSALMRPSLNQAASCCTASRFLR